MTSENGGRIAEASVLLSLLLFTATPGFSQAFSGPKTESSHEAGKYEEIPLEIYRDYVIVIQGSLGDTHRLNFILDTGTNPSIVDGKIAKELSMVETVGRLAVHDKRFEVQQSVLPTVQLGSLRTEAVPVVIRDLAFLQRGLGIRIDAVIGLDVLTRRNFSINYTTKRMRLGSVHLSRSEVALQSTPSSWLIAPMEVDGVPLRMLVDTAASGIFLFKHGIRHRLPHLTSLGEIVSSNMGGEFLAERVLLTRTNLGDADFGHMNAFVVEDWEDETRDFDGLIGPSALGLKQIAFDFQRRALSWKK
jgi:hypothetical protein